MAAIASPFVRWSAHAACRLFYRVDRAGAPPGDGPLLLVPNHPNALLDPAIVWATAGRDVRFLAKSTLFATPLRPLLAGAGAIPVYRRLDQGVDRAKNSEMFAAVDAALANGDAVCIFPEGLSHSTGRLEPLRTGAARMALAAAARGTRLAIVPVGLNFDRKTTFRSRVTIVYGRPFSCDDLAREGAATPAAVHALTARIAARMRNVLVEADPAADAALVDRVDRLYAAARREGGSSEDRVARRRAIAAGIERLRAADPHLYEDILLRLRRYDQRLRRFGLRDRHLDWQVTARDAAWFALRESVVAVVLGPLAIATIAVYVIPYRLTGVTAAHVAREPDVAATATVVSGALLYAVWIALLVSTAAMVAGLTAALLTAVVLLALGVAGLFALEREAAVLDAVRAWFLLRRTRSASRARLRRRRSELADVLDDVNRWLAEGHRQA